MELIIRINPHLQIFGIFGHRPGWRPFYPSCSTWTRKKKKKKKKKKQKKMEEEEEEQQN